nr:PHD finger protein MALE MEIOCYTE DEATH 1-like [Ipomoea batatas]GMD49138.1 PHD finger protein MALE MEIOCYTE DEATH 1-like [Ipomoea batatas]
MSIATTLSSSQHEYDDEEEAAGEREGGSRLTNTRTKEKLPASGKGIHALSQVKRYSPSNSKTLFFKALDQDYYSEWPLRRLEFTANVIVDALKEKKQEYTLQE